MLPSRKITYFAVDAVQVDGELRQPGDLIPEASAWAQVEAEVRVGRIQPVLVSSLSQDDQDYVNMWWDDQDKAADAAAKAAAKQKPATKVEEQDESKNALHTHTPLKDEDEAATAKKPVPGVEVQKERKSA